jgi:hypothetical protein
MDTLLRHIDSHSIMDVLLAITWDTGLGEKPLRDLSFFHEHGLVPKLVAKFDPSEEVYDVGSKGAAGRAHAFFFVCVRELWRGCVFFFIYILAGVLTADVCFTLTMVGLFPCPQSIVHSNVARILCDLIAKSPPSKTNPLVIQLQSALIPNLFEAVSKGVCVCVSMSCAVGVYRGRGGPGVAVSRCIVVARFGLT